MIGVITSNLIYYWVGWYDIGVEWSDIRWGGSLVTFVAFPASLFLGGALLGDSVKRVDVPEYTKPGLIEKLGNRVSIIDYLRPLLEYGVKPLITTIIGPTIAALLIWLITGQLPNTNVNIGGH